MWLITVFECYAPLQALETASKVELEAKGADAVARKAESQARAARVAQQAAEMKVAREEGAKESGDEALAKAISEAETIESRLAVAITKEENCAEAANAAKMAMEAKRAELADAQALATQLEELAVAAEAREQHRIDTEETAKQLEEEAKEALAAVCALHVSPPGKRSVDSLFVLVATESRRRYKLQGQLDCCRCMQAVRRRAEPSLPWSAS